MPTKKKLLGIVVAAIALVLAAAGSFFWRAMEAPFYVPGMVRAGENLRAPLDPPARIGRPPAR